LHEHRHRLNFLFIGTRLTAFIEIHSLHLLFFWYFLSSPEYRWAFGRLRGPAPTTIYL